MTMKEFIKTLFKVNLVILCFIFTASRIKKKVEVEIFETSKVEGLECQPKV